MYLDCTVKIPENKTGISRKKIKGTTYIYYEYGRRYDSRKKYNVPQCTAIGKLDGMDDSKRELQEIFSGCRASGGTSGIGKECLPDDWSVSGHSKGDTALQAG